MNHASVKVDGEIVGQCGKGLMVLIGVDKGDTEAQAKRLAERLLSYRVFTDDQGKMNLSTADIKGELLLVSQFTLAADTKKGNRPSFSSAAHPDEALQLFNLCVETIKKSGLKVATGQFGADMKVSLENDGPVTFLLTT